MAGAKIELDYVAGEERRKVTMSYDQWGSQGWQLLVDHYYWGDLHCLNGVWSITKPTLESEDIQILGELIQSRYPELLVN